VDHNQLCLSPAILYETKSKHRQEPLVDRGTGDLEILCMDYISRFFCFARRLARPIPPATGKPIEAPRVQDMVRPDHDHANEGTRPSCWVPMLHIRDR